MEPVYFYAPNRAMHYLFDQDSQSPIEISNNFTFWIVRTYKCLRKVGFPCQILDHLPKQGIVIADRDTLDNKYPYLGATMLICAKGDRQFHPSAYLHVVQNPNELSNPTNNDSIWNPYYISPWPQPSLIPRSQERGSRVENIAFLGTRSNFAKELSSEYWRDSLKKIGCSWHPIFEQTQWSDYTNLDAIVAVRSFDNNAYSHKPASKLINCWRALVPGAFPPESAYMSLRKSELDFCLVNTLDELIQSITSLKNNSELYLSMIENGKERARDFSEDKITDQWINFFQDYVFIQYKKWLNMPEYQKYYLFSKRYARLKQMRFERRIQNWIRGKS